MKRSNPKFETCGERSRTIRNPRLRKRCFGGQARQIRNSKLKTLCWSSVSDGSILRLRASLWSALRSGYAPLTTILVLRISFGFRVSCFGFPRGSSCVRIGLAGWFFVDSVSPDGTMSGFRHANRHHDRHFKSVRRSVCNDKLLPLSIERAKTFHRVLQADALVC